MKYWIWLQTVLGYASKTAGKFLKDGISAEFAYYNRNSVFKGAAAEKAKQIPLSFAEDIIEKCEKDNIGIITLQDLKYPKSLLKIDDPPLVLYYKGDFPDFENYPSVAVVGPRKVSSYGYKCAYSLAARLAVSGFIIVSGGAIGADYAAHSGAVINGGKTVAVLGNGFGDNYLKQNELLRKKISEKGCLITEYQIGAKVTKYNFPQRNRIMAAISNGTVLVEAPKRSGALITANYAVEYNKDVFVIPGMPGKTQYEGSNLLLRDGAKPLIDISDIFCEYLTRFPDKIDIEKATSAVIKKPSNFFEKERNDTEIKVKSEKSDKKAEGKNEGKPKKIKKTEKILPEYLSKNAKIVYNSLDNQIFSCDDLLKTELKTGEIMSALGELEIYGFIVGMPGGNYSLKQKE